jgi:hypothetical protein
LPGFRLCMIFSFSQNHKVLSNSLILKHKTFAVTYDTALEVFVDDLCNSVSSMWETRWWLHSQNG